MATAVLRRHDSQITSGAAAVNGAEIRAGGNPVEVQFVGPATLGALQGSMDKLNWSNLDDDQGNSVSGVSNDIRMIPLTPIWVRHSVAIDASQPRTFKAIIAVIKESR